MKTFFDILLFILTWLTTHWKELGAVIAALVDILTRPDISGFQELVAALAVLFLGNRAVTNKTKLMAAAQTKD
jgi:hypothetical protein